jgi:pyridoxamine 5'-phosphate oxidase
MTASSLRREYTLATLNESDVDADPIRQFERWYGEAQAANVNEPSAMTLATADRNGTPSARVVLLKDVDQLGFTFYTDFRSRKAADLAENPRVALVFLWKEMERQVRVSGLAVRVSDSESAEYFATRPRGSQLGAWASTQSRVLGSRDVLEAALGAATVKFEDGPVPLPPHWGGFRVTPSEIEFWQGRASRLHDRLRYRREDDRWVMERLSP